MVRLVNLFLLCLLTSCLGMSDSVFFHSFIHDMAIQFWEKIQLIIN